MAGREVAQRGCVAELRGSAEDASEIQLAHVDRPSRVIGVEGSFLARRRRRGATRGVRLFRETAGRASPSRKDGSVEIRGVLFDLGGTLFSYGGNRRMGSVVSETAAELGIAAEPSAIGSAWREASATVMRAYASKPYYLHKDLFQDTLRHFATELGAPVPDALAESFHSRQRDAVVGGLPIREDCLSTLRALKERGLYLSIVSNIDDDYLDPLVARNGLADLLDDWTSSEEAASCKPDVAIYHHALEKAGIGPASALFVGDSLHHDIAGASKVGLRSARIVEPGVTTPLTQGLEITAEPDWEISALAELVGIVDGTRSGAGGSHGG